MHVPALLGSTRAAAALTIVAIAVALAGCGSSSSSRTKSTSTAVAQTSAGTGATSSTSTASTPPSSSTASSSSASSSSASAKHKRGHGSHALTKAQAWAAYEAIAKPVAQTGNAFNAKVKGSDTGQQIAAKARPLEAAYRVGDAKLLALARRYPPAAADLKAMVKANMAFVGDLEAAGHISALTQSKWTQRYARDAKHATAEIARVHSDLQ